MLCRAVPLGSELQASLLAVINLKTIGIPVVWAKATTQAYRPILRKLKVDRIFHPEGDVGMYILQVLHNSLMRAYDYDLPRCTDHPDPQEWSAVERQLS